MERSVRVAVLLATLALAPGLARGHSAEPAEPTEPEPAEPAFDLTRARELVAAFAERFRNVEAGLAENLESLYTEDVVFEDPITRVEGIDALRAYLEHFAEQAGGARFEIEGDLVAPGEAAIFWRMILPGEGGEAERSFPGVSRIFFRDRIHAERDYFDLGEAVYERVPLVAWIVRRVKARLRP